MFTVRPCLDLSMESKWFRLSLYNTKFNQELLELKDRDGDDLNVRYFAYNRGISMLTKPPIKVIGGKLNILMVPDVLFSGVKVKEVKQVDASWKGIYYQKKIEWSIRGGLSYRFNERYFITGLTKYHLMHLSSYKEERHDISEDSVDFLSTAYFDTRPVSVTLLFGARF